MTRAIVGILDARRRADGSRLAVALAPAPARSFEDGPLRVSYDGAQGASASSLCLLDGHLDNEAELADDLGAAPETSTEELLRIGYRRWGEGLPARLRGDFALLVWDGRRAEGLLARDHLGVRSIYLHEMDGALYFATEIRHLLGVLARRPGPDPAGVAHWLAASSRPDSG
ncbi:MAG: hypothetical protein QOG40_1649, partial [Solirubrobacteraceae bacterium]|nr:hypothetical protein [Solirubrobacteraceae bacterium]